MLYGIYEGRKTIATPNGLAICPGCGGQLIAKCGRIKIWHWAHKNQDCPWAGAGETDWHLAWKAKFPEHWCEVSYNGLRADIRRPDGLVIELQNSSISVDDIYKREAIYKNMVWLINGREFSDNFQIKTRQGQYGDFYTVKWRWARKSLLQITTSLFIDFDFGIFYFKKFYDNGNGWGTIVPHDKWLTKMTNGIK